MAHEMRASCPTLILNGSFKLENVVNPGYPKRTMIDEIIIPATTGSLCFRLGRPHDIIRGGKAANDTMGCPKKGSRSCYTTYVSTCN
jgi:hypothetical protein